MMPATQPSNRSTRTYEWIIFFKWDLNEEHPFSIVPVRHFKGENDFPIELITGALSDKARCTKFRIRSLNGNSHSIFCKIETGNAIYQYSTNIYF